MLTHDASGCPKNVKIEPTNEDDDDNDNDADYPPGFDGDNNTSGGPEPFVQDNPTEQDKGDNPSAAKKRKTEASSSNSEDQPPSTLVLRDASRLQNRQH